MRNTCNEVQKKFFTGETNPHTSNSSVCVVDVPGTRYAAPGTRRATLEYLQRVLVQYSCTYIIIAGLPHILISPSILEASRARFRFTSMSSTNTPITWSEGNLFF